MGILLFFLSELLGCFFTPIGIVFGLFKHLRRGNLKEGWVNINAKAYAMAISKDKYENVVCGELFNATLIKNSKNLFGSHRQTVSTVLGINLKSGNLTITGRILNYILNMFDKNHAIKSIE